jgi:SAM-dependent methyltransferase
MALRLTHGGERVDVRGRPRTHTEQDHLGRYLWSLPQLNGRVLDVACGTGYGSELIATRSSVVGIDNEPGALEVASARVPTGVFRLASVPPIPESDRSFDAVVAFETIEHIGDDEGFVREIRRVLNPSGLLLLSTPNKAVTSPDGPPSNPWHAREYLLQDLVALLRAGGFVSVEVFCQGVPRQGFSATLALRFVARFPILCQPGRWWDRLAHGTGRVDRWDKTSVPTLWVLACHLGEST